MFGRLILATVTRLARRAGFHGIDDITHAALLATIEEEAAS